MRRRDLHADDIGVVRNLPVTRTALTVLETAVILEEARPGDGTTFLDRALQTCTSMSQLYRAHERNLGRTGSARATSMLTVASNGGESEAERIFLRLLRCAGLSGWSCAVASCGYVIDVAFESRRVAIEIDGWTVLRFTYHRLIGDPSGYQQLLPGGTSR
ncbi:MAG: hypothetical protein WA931_11940 [Rhodococcus sp. (in: high G+C Gram-positive bacteria)]